MLRPSDRLTFNDASETSTAVAVYALVSVAKERSPRFYKKNMDMCSPRLAE